MLYNPDIQIEEHEDVYSPDEDSILLIESLDVSPMEKILELGCGSGVVSIHCAKNGAEVTAVDINPTAVEMTRKNALKNRVFMDVRVSDVYDDIDSVYDTIVFNLPYLPVEEEGLKEMAWSGGETGLGPLPKMLNEVRWHLGPRGRFVIVVSSLMDQNELSNLLKDYDVKTIGEKKLFYELLKVLEIRF